MREPVRLTSREALRIFDLADIWAARTNNTVRLVSANDHVHGRRSVHYEGLAIDLHSSDLSGLARALRGAGYRVLWNVPGHYGHVHVEYHLPRGQPPRTLLASDVRRAIDRTRGPARAEARPGARLSPLVE